MTENKNPFLKPYNTPHDTAPFHLIKIEHYEPALLEGMKEQNEEIDAIVNNPEAPTFQNTIVALEKSGALLDRVTTVFGNLMSAETSDEMQELAEKMMPVLSEHSNNISLNEKLFARIKAVYEQKDQLQLKGEDAQLLQKTYDSFVRSGANLTGEAKEKFRQLNTELSILTLRFSQNLLKETNVLCIVNTKKKAQKIYKAIKGEGVYHLSTSMYPKHRKRMLKQIKERLDEGKKCIVIATSLVEAGVDLDFCTVYRQIAGMDSIIQAAGRCNREGKRTIEESKVVIFQFDDTEKVPGQRQQIDVSKALLADECKVEDLQTVTRYFEMLYHMRGESLDKKKICEELNGGWHNFATVGKEFKLIEENTVTIVWFRLLPSVRWQREVLFVMLAVFWTCLMHRWTALRK